MKKFLVLGIAAAAAVSFTGCKWCEDPLPQDPSCVQLSHNMVTKNSPATTSMVTPNIAISREVFRPVFRAGSGRLTVVGSGSDRENATYDAIAKFLAKANCDFIVSVSTVAVEKKHPTWWWFMSHTNWSVTISGIPVYLDKLSCETLAPDKVDAYDGNSGVFLPSRGYDSSPAKATRQPLPPKAVDPSDKLPVNRPIPYGISTAAPKAEKASSGSLLGL